MPRGNQLARQWQLLQMIQHPAGIAADDAAPKLDCTLRTIWRDLTVLQKASPLCNTPYRGIETCNES